MELKGKNVVVTGGSDGIGRHICLRLAAAGCNLAILGRDTERLAAVVEETVPLGAKKALAFSCDFCDSAALATTADAIQSAFDDVDVLINNAGIWHKAGRLDSISADVLAETVQVNLTSLMQLTRLLLPNLRRQSESAIINVASQSGVRANAGQSVYSATKYGVRGFTDVLKLDEAESGVRVAGLYQSGTNTQMFAKAGEEVPNRVFTEPEDLADVIVFMLSRPPKLWMHDVRITL